MSNVPKFIEIRQHIESLTEQIAASNDRKTIPESSKKLDEANKLLAKLTAMADNDVQEVVIERLTGQLAGLGARVEVLVARKRVVKTAKTAKAQPAV